MEKHQDCTNRKKDVYKKPEADLIPFSYDDIICTSGDCYGGDHFPHLNTF